FFIENISLPPEVEQALDQRTKMGVLGDLNRYTQYKTAEAIGDAAKNQGGMAGLGSGIAAGVALSDQMRNAIAGSAAGGGGAGGAGAAAPQMPPPIPGAPAVAFFMVVNGQQQGPFDVPTLAAKARDGSLTRTTLVWRPGMANWTPAEQ